MISNLKLFRDGLELWVLSVKPTTTDLPVIISEDQKKKQAEEARLEAQRRYYEEKQKKKEEEEKKQKEEDKKREEERKAKEMMEELEKNPGKSMSYFVDLPLKVNFQRKRRKTSKRSISPSTSM